ncbi:MAG: hypothetical protein DRP82_01225 [Planctomycetota bacterium]|nr:MAG: hypothetical protein DRP82_01225 [Planctomycetota bacterium]
MSEGESYTESVLAVVAERGLEVVSLADLYEWVYKRREELGLIAASDLEAQTGTKSLRWKHRVRSALWHLRRTGRAVKIGRAKYRFLL